MIKICKGCGNEFKTYPSVDKKYCSSKCYHSDMIQDRSHTKICEYCSTEFKTLRKKQVLCSRDCLYKRRKERNWTESVCLHCGTKFKHRKKVNRMFCSEDCQRRSDYKKNKLSEFMTLNNPMHDPASIQKIGNTKLRKYGNPNYNNTEKNKDTCRERYGVPYAFHIPGNRSNGMRISKPQRKLFEQIKQNYPDALLEHYLADVEYSVDIFIPSENKVIELYGDYWHCNPNTYKPDYHHKQLHMKASDKWATDAKRQKNIEKCGYKVEIIWESQV